MERNQLIKVQDKAETTKSCSRRRQRRQLTLKHVQCTNMFWGILTSVLPHLSFFVNLKAMDLTGVPFPLYAELPFIEFEKTLVFINSISILRILFANNHE